jgi:hypothetical protein
MKLMIEYIKFNSLKLFFPYIPTQQAIAHDTIVR